MSEKILLITHKPSASVNIERVTGILKEYHCDVEYAGVLEELIDIDKFLEFCELIRVKDIETPVDSPRDTGDPRLPDSKPANLKPHLELYDGFWIQRKLNALLPDEITGNANIVIVITGLLFGTFGEKRYHARAVLMGEPNIISTTGIVEGPARPPEYYWIKARFLQSKMDLSEIDEIYRDRYLLHDDERLSDVVGSYALQPVAYALTGEAFCDNKDCCLYNSHWQKEILDLQFRRKMCEKCYEKFKKS